MPIIQILRAVGMGLLRVLPTIVNAVRALGPGLMRALSRIGPMLASAWTAIVNAVRAAWNWIAPLMVSAWTSIANALKAAWSRIAPLLASAWTYIANALKAAWSRIAPMLASAWTYISNALKAAWGRVGPMLANAWTFITNALKGAGSKIGPRILPFLVNAAKFLGGGLRRVFGLVAGRAFPFLGNATKALGGIFQSAASQIAGAVKGIANGLASIGGYLLHAATMLGDMMMQAVQASMEYAKSVNDLRLRSGMSTSDAVSSSSKFGGFGITPEMLAEARGGDHESLYRLRARFWRVDPNDPASINARARQLGNSFQGHMLTQQMLTDLGHNTPEGRRLAALPPDLVQSQLNFQKNLGQQLNIAPESIKRMAEVLPLAMERLKMFVQMVQLKFVETALPVLERAFALLSRIAVKSASTFQVAFEKAIGWFYVYAPVLLIQGAQAIVGALKWVSDTMFATAFAILDFIETIENPNAGIGLWLGYLAQVQDSLYNIGKTVADTLYYVRDHLSNFVKTIANVVMTALQKIAQAADWLPDSALTLAGLDRKTLNNLQNPQLYKINPVVMGQHTQNWQHPQHYNNFLKWQQSHPVTRHTQPWRQSLTERQKQANNLFGTAFQGLNDASAHFGPIAERQRNFDTMMAELRGIRNASEKVAGNTADGFSSTGKQDWLARFAIEQAKQQYLMSTR